MAQQTLPITITLEISAEDAHNPDPAALNEVALNTSRALQQDGYTINPLYTGQRGGLDLLFQVITSSAQTASAALWAQKDVVGLIGNLCTIFTSISPIAAHLFHMHGKQTEQDHDIKVSIKIDDAEIAISSADIANDERIYQLAQRFLAEHPTTKVTPSSKVKVQARVPQRKARRKR
jgi:hypothetical protein